MEIGQLVRTGGAQGHIITKRKDGTFDIDCGDTVYECVQASDIEVVADEQPPQEPEPVASDPGELTVAELKAELDARGVAYPSGALKADLVSLLKESAV